MTTTDFRMLPVLLTLGLGWTPALAQAPVQDPAPRTVERGVHAVTLPPMGALCALDREQEVDARLLRAMDRANGGQNAVIALYADCAQLGQLRASGEGQLRDTASILMPGAVVDESLILERPALVAGVARDIEAKREFLWDQLRAPEQYALSAAIPSTESLGILRQTDDYVLTGSRQTVDVRGADQPRDEVTVTGITKAGTALVSVNITADVAGRDAQAVYLANLETLEAFLQALVSANPDPALPSANP